MSEINNKKSQKYSELKDAYEEEKSLGLSGKIVEAVKDALEEDDIIYIRRLLEGLSEFDIAELIEQLDRHSRRKLVSAIADDLVNNPNIIIELHYDVCDDILYILGQERLVKIIDELESDEAVEILEHLSFKDREAIIDKLSDDIKHKVVHSLSYPEDSAGRLMSRDFVTIPKYWTVKEVKEYLLKEEELPEDFYTLFVINARFKPVGTVSLDKLLRAKANERISDLMDGEITPIDAYQDQEDVAYMFRKYGWMSAIVVDKNGRLVGVVTIDDVVDVIHEEADEDIMQLAGVSEGDIYKDGLNTVKSRFVWLFTNLFVAVFVSSIVGMFEGIIAQYALLAVLMPIVASMGGNAGHQTLAVMVRAIATKELSSSNSLRVLTKEFFVGSVNGLLFALLVGVVTYFWFENKTVSYVISMAMICNLVLAGLAGAIIPLTLDKLKIDPAVSSGVFVTAFTDAGGFFIFLGLAKIFLF